MGMCIPSGGVFDVYGPYRHNIDEVFGFVPNSRIDYYDEITGKLLQRRWFDADGNAVWDRDYDHNNSKGNHVFPHDHYWRHGYKKNRPEYKGENGELTNPNYC